MGPASMWPRPLRRGEPKVHLISGVRQYELQCGHGLYAVENHHAMAVNYARILLQCGHGLYAVENEVGRGVGLGRPLASMWPRPLRRGEPRTAPWSPPTPPSFN